MPATKTQTPKFDLTINVPVVMDIRYLDVWPDRNGYGSQVSLKGTVNGETQQTFLKGKTWANLKALHAAGVIGDYDKAIEDPAERVNVPVLNGSNVTLCRRQLAGEKFATLIVSTDGVQSREPGTPSQPGRTGTATQPPMEELGTLPGEYDDEPPPVEEAFREVAHTSPTLGKLDALFGLQAVCFDHAIQLAKRAEKAGIAPTLEGVSALTAQMVIAASQRGINV